MNQQVSYYSGTIPIACRFLYALMFLFVLIPFVATSASTLMMAHRGTGDRGPENTIIGAEIGLSWGTRVLELDLRLTSDGVPVLMHDSTIDRTTDGTGPISELTLAEVKLLDAGSYKSPVYAGERVPTLNEIIDAIDGRARIFLDSKRPVETLSGQIKDHFHGTDHTVNDFYLFSTSFNATAIAAQNMPGIRFIYAWAHVTAPDTIDFDAWKALGLKGVYVNKNNVTRELIDFIHEQDLFVYTAEFSNADNIAPLIEAGVDFLDLNQITRGSVIIPETRYADGDADRDGDVDAEDYLIWADNNTRMADAIWSHGDFNWDGRVDGFDYTIWQSNYGQGSEGGGEGFVPLTSIPEPITWIILLPTLVVLRRKQLNSTQIH